MKLSSLRTIMAIALSVASARAASVYDFTLNSIDGKPVPLSTFKGKVLLLVNVASRCGYTPQYAGLESLYEANKDKGFLIIGIPANNFMSQEPGTNAEIKTFCHSKYNVQFPMMSKVSVKGEGQDPLYLFLTSEAADPGHGGEIQWNFTKFLISRDGKILARFEPPVTPDDPTLVAAVEAAVK